MTDGKIISQRFGVAVKRALDARGKSQYWLADEVDMYVSSVNRIVTGKSEALLSTAVRIADALGEDLETLVSDTGGSNE